MYLKINGSDEKYEANLMPFKTQHGNQGIRVYDMPETDQGFKVYNDDDTVFSDFSAYIYKYRDNEYTAVEEVLEPASTTYTELPPSPYDILNRKVDGLNNKVTDITPYTDSKKAYYGEVEKVFYGIPQGETSIFFDNYSGEYSTSRAEDRLVVKFPERLTDTINITIMVQ